MLDGFDCWPCDVGYGCVLAIDDPWYTPSTLTLASAYPVQSVNEVEDPVAIASTVPLVESG